MSSISTSMTFIAKYVQTAGTMVASMAFSTVKMFRAEISPGIYTGDQFCQAIENAMNNGHTCLNQATGTATKSQNTYNVEIAPITGKVFITAMAINGATPPEKTADEVIAFSVRPGNLPDRAVTVHSATQNPYNVNGSPPSTDLTTIVNSFQDSYHKIILSLSDYHNFIPGDSVIFTSTAPKFSNTIGTVVSYVNGNEVHLLTTQNLSASKRSLTGCTIRMAPTAVPEDFSRSVELNLNPLTYRSGLLVSMERWSLIRQVLYSGHESMQMLL